MNVELTDGDRDPLATEHIHERDPRRGPTSSYGHSYVSNHGIGPPPHGTNTFKACAFGAAHYDKASDATSAA